MKGSEAREDGAISDGLVGRYEPGDVARVPSNRDFPAALDLVEQFAELGLGFIGPNGFGGFSRGGDHGLKYETGRKTGRYGEKSKPEDRGEQQICSGKTLAFADEANIGLRSGRMAFSWVQRRIEFQPGTFSTPFDSRMVDQTFV
jgi:hypothetical protein